jgi:spermidine/putrescine transport system substrate-binding protein
MPTIRDAGPPRSRREFLKRAAAVGLAPMAMSLTAPRGSAAAEEITYFTWSGYELAELHPSYVEKHGKSPNIAIFAEEEEAFQKLRGGFKADLAHPCTYAVPRWREAGLLAPIDVSRLGWWPDLFERLKDIEGTVADGQHWFVPVEWGRNVILYRSDLVEIGPDRQSWSLLFDEKLKGKIAMFDGVEQAVFAAAMVAGFEDPFSLSDEQLQEVRELLQKQKSMLRFYWSDQTTLEQALASGEVVAALAWNASYVTLKGQGVPVSVLSPKEGDQTWVCGLVRIAGGEGPEDRVYDFLNAELDPRAGKYFIEQYNYAHSNRRAFEMADAAKLEELGLSHPDEIFKNSVFLRDIATEELRQKYNRMFEEVKFSG